MSGPDIRVVVGLGNELAKKAQAGSGVTIEEILAPHEGLKICRVYGRRRFAEVEVSEEKYGVLRDALGESCVVSRKRFMRPF